MDQSPPYPQHPHGALIEDGAHLAGWLVAHLRDRLAATLLSLPFLRHLIRHYLTPAESALRRAIHLIADSLDPVSAPSSTKPAHPRAGGGLAGHKTTKPCAPTFRLTEPALRPKADYIPESQRPRISVIGAPSPIPPKPVKARPDAAALEARLLRRLAAFDAAYAAPLAAARRLQRLRLSKRPALTRIPGLRAEPINEIALALLQRLQSTVEAEAARTADTS